MWMGVYLVCDACDGQFYSLFCALINNYVLYTLWCKFLLVLLGITEVYMRVNGQRHKTLTWTLPS